MKFLLILVPFFFFISNLMAQDTVKKLFKPSISLSKLQAKKIMSVQQSITGEINIVLDSLANNAKEDVLQLSTVKSCIDKILFRYWKNGALLGSNTTQAYFIKTGLQTMTHTDFENGRLIVVAGIAPVKPAEFVSIQFEQMLLNKKIVLNR